MIKKYPDDSKSNLSLAELKKSNLEPWSPIEGDYMISCTLNMAGVKVDLYCGKNDEESEIPLWQIWPEQQVPFFKKLFGNVDKSPELKVRSIIENIVKNIEGVSDVEWKR